MYKYKQHKEAIIFKKQFLPTQMASSVYEYVSAYCIDKQKVYERGMIHIYVC